MAEFQEVMKQWVRRCDMCPDYDQPCKMNGLICNKIIKFPSDTNWQIIEDEIMQWAAEHPEPVYPTWEEYLRNVGVIPTNQDIVQIFLKASIPDDIAEKLGLKPKEST